MIAEHVELALLEDTFVPIVGLQPPFSDRISSVAARTGGVLLFDVRVFDDASIERIAAIAYGEIGSVVAAAMKCGKIKCTTINDTVASECISALAAWAEMPISQRATTDYTGSAALLLLRLRNAGRLDRTIE
ncbi:conserved hypothetical protein [Mesorhizobium sp. ORS 3324]|nr:conserved hypothetical protein [Mesorhizobium sp. ORS 3324]